MEEKEKCAMPSGIPAEMLTCPVETGYESLSMADRLHLMFRTVLYHLQHSDDSLGGQKNVLSILARRGTMTQKALQDYFEKNNIPYDHAQFPDCASCGHCADTH